jgi:hypothetical protein
MRHLAWLLPVVLVGAWILFPRLAPARAEEPAGVFWEYKMVLLPLERKLDQYEKVNTALLGPLQALGEQGWEMVAAYEPSHGFMAGERASTEFWFKRRFVPVRR